mmetsp:Transcript_7476/g.15915  ORF Transcript_7476/g.15915 Transcript_7476/m.15915 type:complete len:123 (+) Transcript_7476:153-521(+)
MGRWGAGNFECDGACDYIVDLVEKLSKRIDEVLDAEDGCWIEDDGDDELVPSVVVVTMLAKECGGAPPKPDVVETWKTRYLALCEEQLPGLGGSESFICERLEVLTKTFDDLLEVARQFWEN